MNAIFELCDKVSPYLQDLGEINLHATLKEFKPAPCDSKQFEHVLYQLEADGYLRRISTNAYDFALTSNGRLFIENGGYKNKFIVDADREQLAKDQITSAISANDAVKGSATFEKKFGNRSLLLTAISVVFIGVTVWQQYRDKTELKLQQIEWQLEQINNTLKHTLPAQKDPILKKTDSIP